MELDKALFVLINHQWSAGPRERMPLSRSSAKGSKRERKRTERFASGRPVRKTSRAVRTLALRDFPVYEVRPRPTSKTCSGRLGDRDGAPLPGAEARLGGVLDRHRCARHPRCAITCLRPDLRVHDDARDVRHRQRHHRARRLERGDPDDLSRPILRAEYVLGRFFGAVGMLARVSLGIDALLAFLLDRAAALAGWSSGAPAFDVREALRLTGQDFFGGILVAAILLFFSTFLRGMGDVLSFLLFGLIFGLLPQIGNTCTCQSSDGWATG